MSTTILDCGTVQCPYYDKGCTRKTVLLQGGICAEYRSLLINGKNENLLRQISIGQINVRVQKQKTTKEITSETKVEKPEIKEEEL